MPGIHTYTEEGTYHATVTITDMGSQVATANPTAIVNDASLTATAAASLSSTEGATLNDTVATFTDGDPNGAATDYTATIDWGDHTSLTTVAGSAMTDSGGTFTVPGTHVYAEEGTYTVTVSIADAGGAATTVLPVVKIADATLSATLSPIAATEGATFNNIVATFTDANPGALNTDFTATIDWGDSTLTTVTGSQISESGGTFSVPGNHAYVEEGTYTVAVTISDVDGEVATAGPVAVVVPDAGLTATATASLSGTEGATLSNTVATFTDADPNCAATDYTATIDWGDHTSLTTVAGSAMTDSGGTFTVPGTHVYAEEGTYTVTVSIADAGGAATTVLPVVKIADAPLSVTATALATSVGSALTGAIATFTDSGWRRAADRLQRHGRLGRQQRGDDGRYQRARRQRRIHHQRQPHLHGGRLADDYHHAAP